MFLVVRLGVHLIIRIGDWFGCIENSVNNRIVHELANIRHPARGGGQFAIGKNMVLQAVIQNKLLVLITTFSHAFCAYT